MSSQKSLHFVVVARHDEEKTFRTVLEYQPHVQSNPDFKKPAGKLANAQAAMPMRMAEVLLQLPERAPDFAAHFPRIIPDESAKRPA